MILGPSIKTLDPLCAGDRHWIDCRDIDTAALQLTLLEGLYGTTVFAIKATLDGITWDTIGESTISAVGLYGPYNVRGLHAICCEVFVVASSGTPKVQAVWLGRGC